MIKIHLFVQQTFTCHVPCLRLSEGQHEARGVLGGWGGTGPGASGAPWCPWCCGEEGFRQGQGVGRHVATAWRGSRCQGGMALGDGAAAASSWEGPDVMCRGRGRLMFPGPWHSSLTELGVTW